MCKRGFTSTTLQEWKDVPISSCRGKRSFNCTKSLQMISAEKTRASNADASANIAHRSATIFTERSPEEMISVMLKKRHQVSSDL